MRILIRAPRFLGDTLLSFPALELLRRARPAATFVVVGSAASRELFERRGDVAEFHALDSNATGSGVAARAAQQAALIRALRRERLDLAVLFKSTLRDALLARAAGARRVAGFRREGNRALLTVAVKSEAGRHYTRNYAYLVNAALGEAHRELPPLAVRATPRRLFRAGETVIGLALGGPHKGAKAWPAAHARELARLLVARGWRLALLGDPGDRAYAADVRGGLAPAAVTDLTGATSVGETLDVVAGLDGLVAIDSFALHAASAFRVPTVLLAGRSPSPIEVVVPRHDRVRVLFPRPEVILDEELTASIPPEAVIDALDAVVTAPGR